MEDPKKNKVIKSEDMIKEEVKFASIDALKLNPDNLSILQEQLLKLDQTKSRDAVSKQVEAFKKAQ